MKTVLKQLNLKIKSAIKKVNTASLRKNHNKFLKNKKVIL